MEKTVPTVDTAHGKVPNSEGPRPPAIERISFSASGKSVHSVAASDARVVSRVSEPEEKPPKPASILATEKIDQLFAALEKRGFEVVGPTLRDGAIVYDRVGSASDLPAGWTDEQEAAHYRLKRRNDHALFGYAVGPQSWKNYLHPAEVRLWAAERQNGAFCILNNENNSKPRAFVGVRACELAAIAVQDRVLLGDKFRDVLYGQRRDGLFVIAVQCTQSAPTCFCASMGSGPEIKDGFDLRLTELLDDQHRFLIEAASEPGAGVLSELETTPAGDRDVRAAEAGIEAAARDQVRNLDTAGIKELLDKNFDCPQWETIAARCLTCANCTMVCPTCFCTNVEDVSDVTGNHAERWRRWDSCFTLNFSYIHGGSVRTSTKARYRQWLTHKLAAWIEQFGSPGCVGCGRCITWCPAGIDITKEIRAMREGANSASTNS